MSQKDGVLTLMIKQLEENDTDIYTCDVGTAKSMAKVTVKGENFSMNEGETTFCSYLHYYTAERFELSFLLILRFYFIFLNPKITILHFVLKTHGQWLHCVVPLEVHSVTQEESQEIRAHMQTTGTKPADTIQGVYKLVDFYLYVFIQFYCVFLQSFAAFRLLQGILCFCVKWRSYLCLVYVCLRYCLYIHKL